MKKTYMTPSVEAVKIAAPVILAGSTLSIDSSVEVNDENDLLSRESNFDFDNF